MKYSNLFVLIFMFINFSVFCQDVAKDGIIKIDKEKILKETSDIACKCIDSIKTGFKVKDSISSEINKCIDKQILVYQAMTQMKDIDLNNLDDKKEVNIVVTTDSNSKQYKKYYYEIERYLMDNCNAIKSKIATNDIENENSASNNSESIKFYNLGLDDFKKENYEKAIVYFKKAIVFDSKFAFAYDNIGYSYRKLNDYDKAIEAYEKSIEIDPKGMMPLQNIAVAYLYKKEYKKAVKAYEKLAKLDDKNPEVYYGIGHIYTNYLFDYEKALENLCIAYNFYVDQKSPYRTDAEKLIQQVYKELKKQGKESVFDEILQKHNISNK